MDILVLPGDGIGAEITAGTREFGGLPGGFTGR